VTACGDRSRSVKLRVLDIARAARSKAKQSQEKLKRAYGQLRVKRSGDVLQQLALESLRGEIDELVPLVRQVIKQTRARIWRGVL
jgi:transposase, IS5 family